jgi:lipid A 3-O-deacylase
MVFSAGPGIEFNFIKEFSFIEAGISPTFITRHAFKSNELGGLFNFTSYAGIYFSPLKSLTAGYRFQHMSNAGLYRPNPGVNLHILEIRIRN